MFRILFIGLILMWHSAIFSQHTHDHNNSNEHIHTNSVDKGGVNYVQNNGQWDASVLYQVSYPAAKMFLHNDGAFWVRLEDGAAEKYHEFKNDVNLSADELSFQAHAWKMEFVNADINCQKYGEHEKSYYHNYFLGNDPSKWAGNVPLYEEVIYDELWPGVDMRWHSEGASLKYDMLLEPGVDPNTIAFRYNGLDAPAKIKRGNLILSTSVAEFKEMQPVAWYGDDKAPLACEFVLNGDKVGFDFPDGYDSSRPIVIDPILVGATYSGCTDQAIYGHCATFDEAGNIYSSGQAFGPGLPASIGAFQATFNNGGFGTDINVNKFSPDATNQIYATYIGGAFNEKPNSIIVNSNEELSLLAASTSADYPTTTEALFPDFTGIEFNTADIVVTSFNSGGTDLIGSTYIGGNGQDGLQLLNPFDNYAETFRGEIMLDEFENIFVASSTDSEDFPVTPGAYQTSLGGSQDAVIFGLTPDCSEFIWSTYLGGTQKEGGLGIRFDENGNVYIIGGTQSADFPTTLGAYQPNFQGGNFVDANNSGTDGFIAHLTNSGSTLSSSTFFGTASNDVSYFLDLDNSGNIYIYGQTNGALPISPAGTLGQDGGGIFLAKLDPTLSSTLISTTIGPPAPSITGSLTPIAFLVDVCENIYISGYDPESGWEVTSEALYNENPFIDGQFYLAVYDSEITEQVYGTFYGGSHVDGGTSRFDKNGVIYQGVCALNNVMPASPGAFAPTNGTVTFDLGVFKIDFEIDDTNEADFEWEDFDGCAPVDITFVNNSVGNQFEWDFGDGSPIDTAAIPTHTYTSAGTYIVQLIAMDSLSCSFPDILTEEIIIVEGQDFTPSFTFNLDCESLTLVSNNTTDNDTLEYNWDMGDGFEFETYDVNHIYASGGDYTVILTATDVFCDVSEEVAVDITVEPTVVTSINGGGIQACDSIDAVFTNSTLNATDYFWDFGDGTSSTEAEPTHTFIGPATYEVILTATNPDACNIQDQDTIIVTVGANQTLIPLYELQQTDCVELTVESNNLSSGLYTQYTWDMGDGTILDGFNITHSYDTTGSYEVTMFMTDTLCDINEELIQTIDISTQVVAIIPNGDQLICAPTELFFETNGIGTATWNFGDTPGPSPITGDQVSHLYTIPGSYIVTLTVTGDEACPGFDETSSIVEVIAPPILSPNFTYTPVGECVDMNYEFTNNSDGLIDNFYWQFGDGNVSDQENPNHEFDLPDIFEVILTVENSVCDIQEEISIMVTPDQQLNYELDDTWICPETDQITLDAAISGATYSWSNGESTQEIQISDPGEYQVVIIENGCSYSDIIDVSYIQPLNMDQIVTQCETDVNTILIPYEDAESYLWQNEIEGQFLEITTSGLFDFTFVDVYGCQQSGVIDATIIPRDANIYIPNSFTPNEDGLNDVFRPITSDLEEYEFTIYNRWGEEIFYSQDVNQNWNGGVQGGESYYVPDGIYSYTILYRSVCSTEKILKYGFVTIIR